MFKDISFGQYYPVDSPVHRLDPRVKMLLTLLFIVGIFFIKSYFGFMVTAVLLLVVILMARLPMASVLKSVRGILLIVTVAAVINLFFIKGGEVLWSWRALTITDEGVHTTIKVTLRLILLISGASLLPLTTTPVAIADGTESLLAPLKLVKVPVRDIAMIMSIALRFIPSLFEETNKIIAAQKARGASFDTGGLIARAKAYNATDKRTKMKVMKLRLPDAVAFLVMAAYFAGILVERYAFPGVMDGLIFGGLV